MDNLQLFRCCGLDLDGVTGGQASTTAQPLILVVDDDEDNLLLMVYVLENIDCHAITAVDGLSALALARTYQPDLILLDVLMPCMDGIEVLSQLRKDTKLQQTPVIAVTAVAITEQRKRLLQMGFNDYVTKPYMIEDIEATVQRYLRQPATIS